MTAPRGPDRLVSFDRTAQEAAAPPHDGPLPLALLALWHGDRVLMVFDRRRRSWELPGGMIEPHESPREAAVHELREEAGQRPDGPVVFVGYARYALGAEQRTEYGALFAGRCAAPRGFAPNAEIAAMRWWDLEEPLPGGVDPLDARLAGLTRP